MSFFSYAFESVATFIRVLIHIFFIKHHSNVTVDILEKLPIPFGLIRYGVAPDHADVKV